jgi:hypothetical protein
LMSHRRTPTTINTIIIVISDIKMILNYMVKVTRLAPLCVT